MKSTIKRQKREEKILLSLKKLHYLTRSQLQTLHDLKSDRNASRVMKQLEPYVSSFRDTENVYYLSSEGRQRVNAKRVCKKTSQAQHFIMRNSLYVGLGCPDNWQTEMEITIQDVTVVADALYKKEGRYHFIEVDYTQKMSVNKEKIERYKKLAEFTKLPPKLIWITTTDYRRKQLLSLCKGLDVQVFTAEDFH